MTSLLNDEGATNLKESHDLQQGHFSDSLSIVTGNTVTIATNYAEGGESFGQGYSGDPSSPTTADGLGGGASFEGGTATFNGATINENVAQGGPSPAGDAGSAYGGGLYAEGTPSSNTVLNVISSTVENNTAEGGVGMDDINGNIGGGGNGGGICTSQASLHMQGSLVTTNIAQGGNVTASGDSNAGGTGGGIDLNELGNSGVNTFHAPFTHSVITDSTISYNQTKIGSDSRTTLVVEAAEGWPFCLQTQLSRKISSLIIQPEG
ncbi:hypothetical protein [Fimbriiglobus ruber]|uniref:hypothetical protein n=1 Tax=Fimbriiglobus ruber TaxID=1908690 RepID=UPI001179D821|nr:hypothetical protein [Fimbriiglobus ruber]